MSRYTAERQSSDVPSFRHSRLNTGAGKTRTASATQMRIVIVEWRIRKGQEEAFLDYWSEKESIEDRSGLVGEYLSHVEDQRDCQWITLEFGEDWTTFVNVGFWSDAEAFRREVGPKIDDTRPPQPFEHQKRRRTFLCPDRWRVGGAALPETSHTLVH